MRVTRETQERTRQRLLEAGCELLAERGLEGTTTRELASRAGVAAGTLFNYFPTKEALALELLGEAAGRAAEEHEAGRREGAPLEETLFALVACELRHLAPYRAWAREVLGASGDPLRRSDGPGRDLRADHLARVDAWLAAAGEGEERDLTLHLWWALYLGVLDFWSRDGSEHQAATLALLDRSTRLFCRALPARGAEDD